MRRSSELLIKMEMETYQRRRFLKGTRSISEFQSVKKKSTRCSRRLTLTGMAQLTILNS